MGTVINNGHGSPQVSSGAPSSRGNVAGCCAGITMKGENSSLVQLHCKSYWLVQLRFNAPTPALFLQRQVNMPNDEAKITMKGETYSLVQLHFHAPSEHTFNGKHALMEAHLVHKNDKSGGFGLVCGWLADVHVGVNWCTLSMASTLSCCTRTM